MSKPQDAPISVRIPEDVLSRVDADVRNGGKRGPIIVAALRQYYKMSAPSGQLKSKASAPPVPRPAYGALLDKKARRWRV